MVSEMDAEKEAAVAKMSCTWVAEEVVDMVEEHKGKLVCSLVFYILQRVPDIRPGPTRG